MPRTGATVLTHDCRLVWIRGLLYLTQALGVLH